MPTKTEYIKELKKYNQDLDKYFTQVPFSVEESTMERAPVSEQLQELIASNIMDVRTEIALMRKHLAADLEGMLARQVASQQQQFHELMSKMGLSLLEQVRDQVVTTLEDVHRELAGVRKIFSQMKVQEEENGKIVHKFQLQMLDFDSALARFDTITKTLHQEVRERFIGYENEVTQLSERMTKQAVAVERLPQLINSLRGDIIDSQKGVEFEFEKSMQDKLNSIEQKVLNSSQDTKRLFSQVDSLGTEISLQSSKYDSTLKDVENEVMAVRPMVSKRGGNSNESSQMELLLLEKNHLELKKRKLDDFSKTAKQVKGDIQSLNSTQAVDEFPSRGKPVKKSVSEKVLDIDRRLQKLKQL